MYTMHALDIYMGPGYVAISVMSEQGRHAPPLSIVGGGAHGLPPTHILESSCCTLY